MSYSIIRTGGNKDSTTCSSSSRRSRRRLSYSPLVGVTVRNNNTRLSLFQKVVVIGTTIVLLLLLTISASWQQQQQYSPTSNGRSCIFVHGFSLSPPSSSLLLYVSRKQLSSSASSSSDRQRRQRRYAYVNGGEENTNTNDYKDTTTTTTTTTEGIGLDEISQYDATSNNNKIMECEIRDENIVLKNELLQYAASYDRGYGASPLARQRVTTLIQQLELYNPSINPADSILLVQSNNNNNDENQRKSYNYSIRYNWRMVWTTAIDVLSLNANPFFTVGAIYQCFAPSNNNDLDNVNNDLDNDNNNNDTNLIITNVIDILPRIQSLLPPNNIPNTLIRLSVKTRAQQPITNNNQQPSSSSSSSLITQPNNNRNRIGLQFEAVQVEPVEILGQRISIFPPVGWNLPKVPDSFQAQGYFDVTYLDNDFLIIRQNTNIPNNIGGLFVLTKVNSIDP